MILWLVACGPVAPTSPVATGQEPPATPDPGGDRVQYHWADDNGAPVTTGPDPIVFGEDGVAWFVHVSTGEYPTGSNNHYYSGAGCTGEIVLSGIEPLAAVALAPGQFVARDVGTPLRSVFVQSLGAPGGTCTAFPVEAELVGLLVTDTFDTTPPARTWVGAWHRVPGAP